MIKSSQLMPENIKYENGTNFISKLPQYAIRAMVQKSIIKRLMEGEDIPEENLEQEIRSLLLEKKAKFETYIQENEEVKEFSNKIQYYIEYFNREIKNNPTLKFSSELTEEDCIVLANKEILPDFDFLYEDVDNSIHITKIKTSSFKNPLSQPLSKNEMYALSIWSKEKYPNKTIYLDYDYLAEKKLGKKYNECHSQHSFEVTDELLGRLKNGFEESIENGCLSQNCGNCSRNQLCNFEEPPINLGTEKTIKALSEIHLTDTQKEVKDFESGISRVIAGAGAGKTLVVAMRVVELIKKGYDPSKICMLTYTTTGAREMTDRVIRYLAGQEGLLVDPSLIKSGTINSFGQDIINDHYEELGYRQAPVVIPDEVRYGIINNILNSYAQIPEWKYRAMIQGDNAKWANKSTALNSAKNLFAEIKKNKWTLQHNELAGRYSTTSIAMIFLMYQQYELEMKQKCFIDFDDQLDLVLELVEKHPSLFDEYGYEHIIMDEYQDSNLKQLKIAKAMIDANSFKSFMGVGDDSQSIFSFQNASPEFIVNFENYFGEYKDFQLVENHRSSRNIVQNANAINALIEDRVEKDLVATKQPGNPITVQGFYTQQTEYQFIAKDIKDRLDAGQDPSTICVLASTGEELRGIASELTKLNIPSVLMNPVPYRKNSRVAALCDFYDSFITMSPKGLIEYENVLRHGALKTASKEELDEIVINKKGELINTPTTIEKFIELAKKLDENETDICYQDFIDRLSYCRTMDELDEFFTDFELYGYDSTCSKTKEGYYAGVSLITVHSAKGLEWDTTYLTLDKFDNKGYQKSPSRYFNEINEKKRLWFVGATRAKENLICVGQYALSSSNNKDGIMLNNFLKNAYMLQNKIYDYSSFDFFNAKARENVKENEPNLEEK